MMGSRPLACQSLYHIKCALSAWDRLTPGKDPQEKYLQGQWLELPSSNPSLRGGEGASALWDWEPSSALLPGGDPLGRWAEGWGSGMRREGNRGIPTEGQLGQSQSQAYLGQS